MATNTKSASAIHAEWDLATSSYIDTFNAVSDAGKVSSSVSAGKVSSPVPVSAKRVLQQTAQPNQQGSDKSAVEAVIQSEDLTFDKIHAAIDEKSGNYVTYPPPGDSTQRQNTATFKTGVSLNYQIGTRFNWFTDGTNLTHTDGPTVNNYKGSRVIWQFGDRFYQKLNVKRYMNGVVAADRYESTIDAGGDVKTKTVAGKTLYTFKEAIAIQNVNLSRAHSCTLDAASFKTDLSVSGISAVLQVSAAKTEIKTGLYACDMKMWQKMDEFRIGVLGYTLWDIGKLSVKNSVTAMAMNNYMGVFCSFANQKVDVSVKDIKAKGLEIVSANSSLSAKLNQVSKVTSMIETAMLNASNGVVEVKKAEMQVDLTDFHLVKEKVIAQRVYSLSDSKLSVESGEIRIIQ